MEILQKYTLKLTPDSTQQLNLDAKPQLVTVETMKFNDGSVRVVIPEIESLQAWRNCEIMAFIDSLDDLMVVSQIKDILQRSSAEPHVYSLNILSTPYTRYDRPMLGKVDGFGAKTFADFVNSLKFDIVIFSDCHSQVMLDLINNSVNLDQMMLYKGTVGVGTDQLELIAPDAGAAKKTPGATITFDKTRDVLTGSVNGMKLLRQNKLRVSQTRNFIVIDDICEGGRTFIEVAKCFKENAEAGILPVIDEHKLFLYVTHGIFSNNAVEKLLCYYDTIFVRYMKQSDYFMLTAKEQNSVVVHTLINA